MSILLVVHHTPSPATRELLEAVLAGTRDPEISGVDVVVRPALAATVADMLDADGYLFGTPANFGYMSGAIKHFFDTVYYPVAETFGALRDLVDEGSPGRNWNDATNMVITGQAAMQVMGDWAKGEFIAAGLTPGEEYGCVVPGQNGYIMGGDVFVFPAIDDDAQKAAQDKLGAVMFAPETQIAFNMNKGSVPVRLDLDVSGMDVCAQKGMALLADPAKQIPSINFLASSDLRGALDDVITEFWNTPSMGTDTFVDNFVSAIETAG
jgi:glucose/mannose transport system substrate-binding protein